MNCGAYIAGRKADHPKVVIKSWPPLGDDNLYADLPLVSAPSGVGLGESWAGWPLSV